jgi:hypothetical protein
MTSPEPEHVHSVFTLSEPLPFQGCVGDHRINLCYRKAHGGVSIVETCACGAQRRTNANQGYEEVGRWSHPDTPDDDEHWGCGVCPPEDL